MGSHDRLPLLPRALLFNTCTDEGQVEATSMPLDPNPPTIEIGSTYDNHHEQEDFHPLIPEIPRARRSPRVTHSRVRSDGHHGPRHDDIIMVPSRFGDFPLVRRLHNCMQNFHPSHWNVPSHIPVDEEVQVWGRQWIVKSSTLHPTIGLGLFSCEDILLPSFPTDKDKEVLFPYCGMVYGMGVWNALSQASKSFKVFGLSPDSYPDVKTGRRVARPSEGYRMLDGDPMRCSNIAAYINSVAIPRSLKGCMRKMVPNVEFVFEEGPPPGAPQPSSRRSSTLPQEPKYDFHILVCAIRSIQKGDELLAHYNMPIPM